MSGSGADSKVRLTSTEVVFAADLGGTHLRAAIVDENGQVHFRLKQETPRTEDPEEIVRALVCAVNRSRTEDEVARAGIRAVSVVVPASVKVAQGIAVKAPNLPCLDGFRLTAALTRELGLAAFLENDANAAAVGEMWQGAGRGCKTIVCITLGTGVGGGIILDGKLWRGVNGSAAEVGHMCVDPFGGVACQCGSQGCLEVYASATAIVRMAREGRPEYPHTILDDCDDLTAEKIHRAGLQGDDLAVEVFRRMGSYLGVGVANLITILDPDSIVLGGGVVNAWDLFAKHMKNEIAQHSFSVPAAQAEVVQGKCGDDAGLLGAARLAFDRIAI